ncbi:MAG: hypothetical protein PHU04_02805 [Candidatus Peribacteraceae bacterium]|nr:hypothetical protein [Candidatus Peribacteraceae bacterium]
MPNTPTQIKEPISFAIYARKSEEADERQALSIDSQLKELQAVAERDGLNIATTHTEAHSALMALRLTADARLQPCLLREDVCLDTKQLPEREKLERLIANVLKVYESASFHAGPDKK